MADFQWCILTSEIMSIECTSVTHLHIFACMTINWLNFIGFIKHIKSASERERESRRIKTNQLLSIYIVMCCAFIQRFFSSPIHTILTLNSDSDSYLDFITHRGYVAKPIDHFWLIITYIGNFDSHQLKSMGKLDKFFWLGFSISATIPYR